MAQTRNLSVCIGVRINGINQILKSLEDGEKYVSQLQRESKIIHKKTFLTYLDFCKEKGLVCSYKTNHKRTGMYGVTTKSYNTWFVLTEKGRLFLQMVT